MNGAMIRDYCTSSTDVSFVKAGFATAQTVRPNRPPPQIYGQAGSYGVAKQRIVKEKWNIRLKFGSNRDLSL